jgi:hypothetical protein
VSFRIRALTVVGFAVAMAYLESAVVVYLERAQSIDPDRLFVLQQPEALGDLSNIEVGREAATIVMLVAIGVMAGKRALHRLAWCAVAFGVWDFFYYLWLWVFTGWPHGPGTWDVLFLIPVPWVGPVWAPMAVSVALVGFGLAAAWQGHQGSALSVSPLEAAMGVGGGLLAILSFTIDTPRLLGGGTPSWFPWPLFAAGMVVAGAAALTALRRAGRERTSEGAR